MPLVSSSARPVAIDIVPERDDERRDAQKRDAQAVDQSDRQPAAEAREDAEQHDQARSDPAATSLSPAMTEALTTLVSATTAPTRKIEAADDQHEHLPRRNDDQIGGGAQHVEYVLHREEIAARTARARRPAATSIVGRKPTLS